MNVAQAISASNSRFGGVRVLPSNKLDLDWIYYNGSLSLFNRVTRMGVVHFRGLGVREFWQAGI